MDNQVVDPDAFCQDDGSVPCLDLALLRKLRKAPLEGVDDVAAAHGLARLVHGVFKLPAECDGS